MTSNLIEILLCVNDKILASDILDALADLPAHVRTEQQLDRIPLLAREDIYDLVICQAPQTDAHLSQILNNLRKELPVVFIILFSELAEIPESLPVHYLLPKTNFDDKKELSIHLHNALRLTSMHKMQADLASMLLHDLRSPTQSIIGYIELLEQEVFGEVNEGQRQILLSASNLGDSIIQLMEELGQVYRFEKNEFTLHKEHLEVKQLLDETLRALWVQSDRKNIKFIPRISNTLPQLFADALAIQRVLNNLVQNAIKFSPENSSVKIEVTEKQNKIEFRIIDSSPGLLEDQILKIFDKFFRISDRKDRHKGQGLGLYICKLIIEAHNGTIRAINNPEGGTIFIFTLPTNLE